MKIRILGLLVGVAAVASSFISCTQPQIDCRVGLAGTSTYAYAAAFIPTQGQGACAELLGDFLGMESYSPALKKGEDTTRDFDKISVAIQSQYLGDLVAFGIAADADHKPYALGDFEAPEPDETDFCTIKTMSEARQDMPALAPACDADPCTACACDAECGDPSLVCDATLMGCAYPATDAASVSYQWSDVQVYVTADAQGTQFSGHVKYQENGCEAQYDVHGVWPGIDCTDYDYDTGLPTGFGNEAACCPEASTELGRPFGSGINPDFPVKCQKINEYNLETGGPLFACVLDMSYSKNGKLPVLSPDWAKDKAKAPFCNLSGNGRACSAAGECASGHCVDGVCCDTACDGTCEACSYEAKGYGSDGFCGAAAAGLDPHDSCEAGAQTTCGDDGTCDGAGACRKWSAGTLCGTCSGGKVCDGAGECVGLPSAYVCTGLDKQGCTDAVGCDMSCASDDECVDAAGEAAPYFCNVSTGTCAHVFPAGQACTADVQCADGPCTDGTCAAGICP